MRQQEIYDIIQANRDKYDYFGLRAVTMNPVSRKFQTLRVGDNPGVSYEWDDGNPTEYELPGASAINIDRDASVEEIDGILKQITQYDDRSQIVLIGSYYMQLGCDQNEIVMYGNATVLAVWPGTGR